MENRDHIQELYSLVEDTRVLVNAAMQQNAAIQMNATLLSQQQAALAANQSMTARPNYSSEVPQRDLHNIPSSSGVEREPFQRGTSHLAGVGDAKDGNEGTAYASIESSPVTSKRVSALPKEDVISSASIAMSASSPGVPASFSAATGPTMRNPVAPVEYASASYPAAATVSPRALGASVAMNLVSGTAPPFSSSGPDAAAGGNNAEVTQLIAQYKKLQKEIEYIHVAIQEVSSYHTSHVLAMSYNPA
jgi:hypothetical protein